MFKRRMTQKRFADLAAMAGDCQLSVSVLPRERCLEIYERLTNAEWVYDLGEQPDGWDGMSYQERHIVLESAVRFIEDRISYKERMKYFRQEKYGETQEQFDAWWESRLFEMLNLLAVRY